MVLRRTALCWCLSSCLFGAWSARGDAVPAKYFGTYPGLELPAVRSGASWEESLTGLEISNLGIFLHAHRDQRGREWKIHYPTQWILNAHEQCLAIKRDADASRPSPITMVFALCFVVTADGKVGEVRMFDADAELFGEYVRNSGDEGRVLWLLRSRFDHLREQAQTEWPRRLAAASEARGVVLGHDEEAKIATLRQIRVHAADIPDSQVSAYVDVISLALWDQSVAVQKAAIDAIERGALFTQAVQPLRELVARAHELNEEVVSRAIRALGKLIYEANQLFERRRAFESAFGTIDLDQIFARTGGIIQATDASSNMFDIFKLHPPPSRAWTIDQRERILRTLDDLAAHGPTPDARREAQERVRVLGTLNCQIYL